MKRLQDNLTSSYLQAANCLNSRQQRRKVVAYVESYDDVFFWRSILSQFETDKLFFEIMLPTRENNLERGKKAALMSALRGKTGQWLVACVDADYDYLIQGATETSRKILNSPFIFHTYAYAIENLQCYAPSLHDVCVAVTLNDRNIFDLQRYLEDFSRAIYPLFVWNIWYYRTSRYGEFTMTDFLRVIETTNFNMDDAQRIISLIKSKVMRRCDQLKKANPDATESYHLLEDDLQRLGVTPETTYLYIQGHHVFDKVVVPMLNRVCDKLVRQRQAEIARQSVHGTQRRNELSCYNNSVETVIPMLKKNTAFTSSEPYKRIKADLTAFMAHDCLITDASNFSHNHHVNINEYLTF